MDYSFRKRHDIGRNSGRNGTLLLLDNGRRECLQAERAAGEGETDAERWSKGDVGASGRAEQGERSAVQAGRFGEGNWTPVP